jgi:hypothetical protein
MSPASLFPSFFPEALNTTIKRDYSKEKKQTATYFTVFTTSTPARSPFHIKAPKAV